MARRPEKTGKLQAGQFRPGQSGNPRGRPPGARNSATVMAEALLDGQAEALVQVVIAAAMDGDMTAMRLCLERLLPAKKSVTVEAAVTVEAMTPEQRAERARALMARVQLPGADDE